MRREMKKRWGSCLEERDGPRDRAGVGGWREEGAWARMWGRGIRGGSERPLQGH